MPWIREGEKGVSYNGKKGYQHTAVQDCNSGKTKMMF